MLKRRPVAVISGASRGIGLSCARLCLQKNYRVFLISQNHSRLHAAYENLLLGTKEPQNPNDDPWLAYQAMDIRDPTSTAIDSMINRDLPEFMKRDHSGRVDLFIHAAGVTQRSLLCRTGRAEVERVFDVNLRGTVLMVQAMCKFMMRSQQRQIRMRRKSESLGKS